MTFGERLRAVRKNRGLSQKALAEQTGIALRTIQNYENSGILPKKRDTYAILARVLDVEVATLMDENAEFVISAKEHYGSRGERQARELIEQVTQLYAGGELSPEDMEAMNRALQEAYWEAKAINRKFVPRKYRREAEEPEEDA